MDPPAVVGSLITLLLPRSGKGRGGGGEGGVGSFSKRGTLKKAWGYTRLRDLLQRLCRPSGGLHLEPLT